MSKNFSRIAMIALGAAVLVFFTATSIADKDPDDLGISGAACYPNKTCNTGLSCWGVGEEFLCFKEVKPVMRDGVQFCYSYIPEEKVGDKDAKPASECFLSESSCNASFSKAMREFNFEVKSGCEWVGQDVGKTVNTGITIKPTEPPKPVFVPVAPNVAGPDGPLPEEF